MRAGHYRQAGVTVSSGIINGWSCCKNEDENALGCKMHINHVEDKETSACLQPFTQQEESEMTKELQVPLVS